MKVTAQQAMQTNYTNSCIVMITSYKPLPMGQAGGLARALIQDSMKFIFGRVSRDCP
jgi:flagella basal body P-ring formation protein FlgA